MKTTLAVTICLWVLGNLARSEEPAAVERTLSETTLKREKQLKAGLANFRLDLAYIGPQDKPFYQLTLSVQPTRQLASDPFHPYVVIDRAEAEKIVGHLASDGFLDRAVDDLNQDITLRAPMGRSIFSPCVPKRMESSPCSCTKTWAGAPSCSTGSRP